MNKILRCSLLTAAVCLTSASYAAENENPQWKTVSASDNTTYAIKADGTLWGWGDNEQGQLGTAAEGMKCSSTPVQIGDDNTWKAAYGARGAGFFIKEDGSLWSIGSNEKGMSGVGDGVTKHTALVQVGTDTDWQNVYTSVTWCYSVLAIKTDGSLWAWGDGSSFSLGQGNVDSKAVPTRVGTDNDWKQASIGSTHVLALKNDGSLWGWGFAPYKQLMNDSGVNVKVPTRLGNDTWTAVYAIDNSSFGVKADGSLWAWGDNQRNLLGLDSDMSELGQDETLTNVVTPTRVTAISQPVTQMSGCEYVRTVVAGDKVLAWGANANGALGNGKGEAYESSNNQYSYVPVEVALPKETVAATLSSGQRFSILLDKNGTLYGWGSNRWGQMGNFVDDSNLTFEPSPVVMGVPAPPKPGEYIFDAENIPSSLADAVTIKMTGEWNTAALQKLCQAIGANIGFPPVGNNKLESVDMSEVTFAENTSFFVSAGMQNAGVFKMCKALKSVKFPSNPSVANITSIQSLFWNCESLTSCDVSALTGVTNITDAFYGTALTMVNLSAWENETKSEDAFGKCSKLASVILPANFTLGKYVFNSCTSLRLIDWGLYADDQAPAVTTETLIFENLTPEEQALITVMVPASAYEAFKAQEVWQYVNLQPVQPQEEGTYTFDANNIPGDLSDARKVIIKGLWDSAAFKALSDAIGNNSGTTGNNVLESIDMSAAEIAIATNLSADYPGVLFGTVRKGFFQNCKALAEVTMPAPDQAAGFRSFQNAFYGCESLAYIDLGGCTGINDATDAFYGAGSLETVILPGSFQFESGTFDRCNSLSKIDWSDFEGSEAPAFKTGSLPSRGKQLTIVVPDGAYDSFVANTSWNGYNIVKASLSGIDLVTAGDDAATMRVVFDLNGRPVATLNHGDTLDNLPAGIYIINKRKILVK